MQFLVVYIREAHALDSGTAYVDGPLVEDPVELFERSKLASQCMAGLKLPMPAIVDKLDDAVNKAYGGWPDRLYLVGKDGKIAYAGGPGPFQFRPEELASAIDAELAKASKRRWF